MPRLLLFLLVVLLAGCELAASPDADRVVAGVDLDVLFEPASVAEMAAVEAEWATRDVSPVDVQVLQTTPTTIAGVSVEVQIVGHVVDGVRHYGAVVTPTGFGAGELPVLVYAHGGDSGLDMNEAAAVFELFPQVVSDFVIVMPSFRDEPLRFGGQTWMSDGPASPWDRDVDDALALLNTALDIEPSADASRIGVLGFSRGGAVGMIMALRDDRIDGVVDFFGPTDFFGPFVQEVFTEALLGTPRDLPGLDVLNERFVAPLAAGALTTDEVRLELVRRSPVLWARDLPRLQVHHGTADAIVPVSQTEHLMDAMSAIGRTAPSFEAFIYTEPGAGHNPLLLPDSLVRARTFVLELGGI